MSDRRLPICPMIRRLETETMKRVPKGLRARARRIRTAWNPPSDAPTQPTLLAPSIRLVDADLPDGVTRESLHQMLSSLSIDGAPAAELAGYLSEDFERFVLTWNLARNSTGRALEVGANPYFTTLLLRELTDLDLELTNCFAPDDPGAVRSQRISYRTVSGVDVDAEATYRPVNVEEDRFPYSDESFDVVLFCEVIEHLQTDPVAAIEEIHRVLRPGGRLVLSTPNVARLENVARLIAGANIYDPYSGYGAYGRHNREYTRHELHRLLLYSGFRSIESFSADVHDHHADSFVDAAELTSLLQRRQPDLGQYLFVTAEKADLERAGHRPSFLYRSLPPGVIETYE